LYQSGEGKSGPCLVIDNSVTQLVALIVYSSLIVFVIKTCHSQYKRYFLVYLFASVGWSLASYISNSPGVPLHTALLSGKFIALLATFTIVSYTYFLSQYVHRHARPVASIGSSYLLLVAVLAMTGVLQHDWTVVGNTIVRDYGAWMPLLLAGNAAFVGYAIYVLVRSFRSSTNPDHRNRIFYLLVGLGLLIIIGTVGEIINRALDHVGHLANAIVISYTVLRLELLDMKLVIRKSLVYGGISIFITACCLVLVSMWFYLLESWSTSNTLVITIAFVVLMAILFNPLRNALEKWTNIMFYGKIYNYRQTLLNFSDKMSNILDLEQLAEAILNPLTNAVHASQASLLFASNGKFTSQYAERLQGRSPVVPLSFRQDGPIARWMVRENRPLTRDVINSTPEFKGLWQEERNSLAAAGVEVLCPVISRQKLVAILALSKKHPRGCYSRDDTDLILTLAHEAAVAIENASLYEKAKQRANTDELTGLFNHRFFHQRLDEEIARASRFGESFTLIFMDLDNFKKYNDISGHLIGDEALRNTGRIIRQTVRDSDVCFRYGGDEFAIILPETSLTEGQVVAARLSRMIASSLEWQRVPLTVSIGIASWPTDGIMKESLLQSADAALYFAKQAGRNMTALACEVALSEVLHMVPNESGSSSEAVVNTVYALAATVDAKDHYTYGHSKKVTQYALTIAEALGYNQEDQDRIRAGAMLHDIGKIGVSDRILQKKETLTEDEMQKIRAHPNTGVAIIRHIESLQSCLAAVRYHHERFDGSGYPAGLKGHHIPLDARILAVADAFDAMTSERPYHRRMTYTEALQELKDCSGTHFDPEIVKVFLARAEISGLEIQLSESA
jgi:diguanylate cyclase (GGDEF)-like protein/putative nucleotidyltransferase with HDIG domain